MAYSFFLGWNSHKWWSVLLNNDLLTLAHEFVLHVFLYITCMDCEYVLIVFFSNEKDEIRIGGVWTAPSAVLTIGMVFQIFHWLSP